MGRTWTFPYASLDSLAGLSLTLTPLLVTKEDIQAHFSKDGTGTITEVKLMNGFGFIEYDDPLDARDMVPGR